MPDLIARIMPIFPLRLLVQSEFDNAAKVGSLSMPVLVQHGSADEVIPEAHGKTVSAAIAGSTYQSVVGAGHELTWEPRVQAKQLSWLAANGL